MTLAIGTRLGQYEIIAAIGAGGMGEVYKAHDTKLKRDVALKLLPTSAAADPERRARFAQEARAIASLTHPNIVTVHSIEEAADVHFLTMELVSGRSLDTLIPAGGLPLEKLLKIASPLADAVAAAHARGITHRDLKPANVMLTPEGRPKVLDFGLAKLQDSGPAGDGETQLAAGLTGEGRIVGTVAYMSPEQAEGKPIDARSDIFSLGVMLYELATGERPFKGDSPMSTLSSILKDQPRAVSTINPALPRDLSQIVKKCLAKDPERRYQSAKDVRNDLDEVGVDLNSGSLAAAPPDSRGPRRQRVVLIGAIAVAIAAIAVAATALIIWRPRSPEATTDTVRKFQILAPDLNMTATAPPSISPDGGAIVYSAGGALWVHRLDQVRAQKLASTDDAEIPFWSPDSTHIAYVRAGRLWKHPVAGGEPTSVTTVPGTLCGDGGGVWEPGGRMLLTTSCSGPNPAPMYGVSDQGGDLQPVLQPDTAATERDFHRISALPEGRGLLLAVDRQTGIDTIAVWTGNNKKTVLQPPGERISDPTYASGHLLYTRRTKSAGVWAAPFSLSTLEVTGEPFLVVANMAYPSVARDGTLVVVPLTATDLVQLVWADLKGTILETVGEPLNRLGQPRLSIDNRRALTTGAGGVWVFDLAGGTRRRLASDADANPVSPQWIGNSDRIVYSVGDRIESRSSRGDDQPTTLAQGLTPVVSRDGRWLAFSRQSAGTDAGLWYLDLQRREDAKLLRQGPGAQTPGAFSPDGRYLAYESRDGGSPIQIYVTDFPGGRGQWQVSLEGGGRVRWSPRGDALFWASTNRILAVDVRPGDPIGFSTPRLLFSGTGNHRTFPSFGGFDVGADGRRLLMRQTVVDTSVPSALTIVENWFAEFAKRR